MNTPIKGAAASFVFLFLAFGAAHSAHAADAALGVTQITAVQTSATADGTYGNGWKWLLNVTVPSTETLLKLKFSNWTSGALSFATANNVHFYSAQSTDAYDAAHAVELPAADTYSAYLHIDSSKDLDASQAGRQIQVSLETRVPVGTADGSYGASYGIDTEIDPSIPPTPTPPAITVSGNSNSASESYNSTVPSNSTGAFTLKFDVTAGDNDVYIPKSIVATTSSVAASDMTRGAVVITDLSGSTTSAVASASSLTSSADTDASNSSYYVVHSGDTETFTASVVIDPSASGYYQIGLDRINFSLVSTGGSLQALEVDETDSSFQTSQLYIH